MSFKKRVLEKRNLTATYDVDRDMNVLHKFWSHFLVPNFNAQMYNEFRSISADGYFSFLSLSSSWNAGTGFVDHLFMKAPSGRVFETVVIFGTKH